LGVIENDREHFVSKVVVLVSYRVVPDRIDEALAAIGALVSTVEALEPDCIGISMLQDTSEATHITLVEQWASQQIFLGPHMQQPHIQSFIQRAASFLKAPPEITFWHQVSGAQQSVAADRREDAAPAER
jgi:quinol monooxygenase YgiN